MTLVIIVLTALALAAQETPQAPPTPKPPRLKARASVAAPRAEEHEIVVNRGGGSYLGVDIDDVSHDRMAALKLPEERGVEITMVDQDAPAGKAGLKPHDVIVAFNGTPVDGVEQMRRFIRETPPGRTVNLGISRDGKAMNVPVQLGEKRKLGKPFKLAIPPIPPMDFDIPQFTVMQTLSRSGVVVENLTPQLGEFFGVKNGEGVLVRSVEKGGVGEAAGLRAGDVIVRVGSERVADMSDWRRVLRSHRGGGTVQVGIVRDKREQTVSITLPERKSPDQSSLDWDMEWPDFNFDLEEISAELAKIQPKIAQAVQVAQAQAQRELGSELRRASKDLEKAQREFGKELRQQMKEAQKEIDRAIKEMSRK